MTAPSPSPSPSPSPPWRLPLSPLPSPPSLAPPSLLVQGKCQCGDSHPFCAVNGWCYQSSISPHWDSAACKGTCEAEPADKLSTNLLSPPALLTPTPPPPSPPPPPLSPLLEAGRCQCRDGHPFCHVNGWCYRSSTSPLWDNSCKGGCETQAPACEGECETQPPDKPSIRLPNRTHLVFNHLPKCAGTELAAVLEECLPTGALTVVGEFARTSTSSQQRSFIVSSIREPCSAYLSLWAYGVAGLGKFREDCATPELYYPPDGNPSAALHADMFHSWLTTPARAAFQKRFDTSFPDPSAVDCWVRVERLDTDLLHCLQAFEVRRCRP
jgi:predicted heme/steroid binding protein